MHKSEKIRMVEVSIASKRSYRLPGDPSIVVSDQALSEVLFMVLFVKNGCVVAKLCPFEHCAWGTKIGY